MSPRPSLDGYRHVSARRDRRARHHGAKPMSAVADRRGWNRLPFSRFHILVITALGVTWVLDGLEVT